MVFYLPHICRANSFYRRMLYFFYHGVPNAISKVFVPYTHAAPQAERYATKWPPQLAGYEGLSFRGAGGRHCRRPGGSYFLPSARRAWKNSDSNRPHSSARTPAVTSTTWLRRSSLQS